MINGPAADNRPIPVFERSMSAAAFLTLALACHWGWNHLILYFPFLHETVGPGAVPWFTSNMFSIPVLFVLLLISPRIERLCGGVRVAVACCVMLAGGTALLVSPSFAGEQILFAGWIRTVLPIAGYFLISMAVPLLIFAYSLSFRRVPLNMHDPVVAIATLTSFLMYTFVSALPIPAAVVFALALPVVICYALLQLNKLPALKTKQPRPALSKSTVGPWALACLFATAASANYMRGAFFSFESGTDSQSMLYALVAITVAVMLAVIVFLEPRTALPLKPMIVCVLFSVCILLEYLPPVSALAQNVISFSAFFIHVTFFYQLLATFSTTRTDGVIRGLVVISIVNQFGLFAGSSLSNVRVGLADAGGQAHMLLSLVLLATFVTALLKHTFAIARVGKPREETSVSGNGKAEEPRDRESQTDGGGIRDALGRASVSLAGMYGLTPREGDVLLKLLEGRNLEGISRELGVSQNTAKSHISHVYQKMEVHTREELYDRLFQTEAAGFIG